MRNFLKLLFNIGITIFSLFIPKSRKYVIVGGWYGKRFADNSRGIYEYLEQNKERIGIKKVYWYTNDMEIYRNLKNQGRDVLAGINPKSVYWHFRSKIHFIDQCPRDILGKCSVRCIRINLWHGFPLKKIGNYLLPDGGGSSKWYAKYISAGFWEDSYLLTTSPFSREVLGKAMGKKKKDCLIASYPRTQNLYGQVREDTKQEFRVFYLPTFRNNTDKNPILKENLEEFNALLKRYRIVFSIKPHFASSADWKEKSYSNICVLDAAEDVYQRLEQTDLLITDYSSVYFDFLLTDRAVLFYPYDYEYYEKQDKGFVVPYDEYTPGDKVYCFMELKKKLVDIRTGYSEYMEKHEKQYRTIKNRIFQYTEHYDYSDILKFWKS